MTAYVRMSAPLSIGGVLDDGLRLYRVSVRPLFVLSLIAALLGNAPLVVMAATIGEPAPGQMPDFPPSLIIAIAIIWSATVLVYAAIIASIDAIAGGRPATAAQALETASRRGLPLLAGWLLYGLATTVGTVLLVVPGLYVAVSLGFVAFPIVLDGKGPLEGLRESHRLVKGLWWRTATLVTVAVVIATIPYLIASFVGGLLTTPLMSPEASLRWSIVAAVLVSVLYAFLLPVLMCLQYSIYGDLLLRKQGSDLRRRLEAVSA